MLKRGHVRYQRDLGAEALEFEDIIVPGRLDHKSRHRPRLLRFFFLPFLRLTATVDIGGSTNSAAVLEDRFLSKTAAPSPLPVITCTRNLLAQSADHQTFLPSSPLPRTFHTTLTLPLPTRSHDGLFELRGRCKQATTRFICWRGNTRRHGAR